MNAHRCYNTIMHYTLNCCIHACTYYSTDYSALRYYPPSPPSSPKQITSDWANMCFMGASPEVWYVYAYHRQVLFCVSFIKWLLQMHGIVMSAWWKNFCSYLQGQVFTTEADSEKVYSWSYSCWQGLGLTVLGTGSHVSYAHAEFYHNLMQWRL